MNDLFFFPPDLLTKKMVAYLLSISEREVNVLMDHKEITPLDDGGRYIKFHLEDVRAYAKRIPERAPRGPSWR